jgi:hypothetical protein
MRALLFASLVGCNVDFFLKDNNFATDIPCSDKDTCPPGQTCVAGEHMCRHRCTRPGPCMSGTCECNNTSGQSDNCDLDGFCRPSCNQGGDPSSCLPGQNSCSGTTMVCADGTCRPPCGSGCPEGFECFTFNSCSACRPTPPPITNDGGVPDGAADMTSGPGMVTSMAVSVQFIALDGNGNLFWNHQLGVLSCALPDCSSPTPFGSANGVRGLAANKSSVVWIDMQDNVMRCATSGCGVSGPTVLAGGQGGSSAVAVDGVAAYWMISNPNRLMRCLFPDCPGGPQSLLNQYNGALTNVIAVGGNDVYWNDNGNIDRCPDSGGAGEQQVGMPGMPFNAISLVYPIGYFSGGDCIKVISNLAAPSLQLFACNGGAANIVLAMAADDNDVFWSIGGRVRHCSTATCNNMPRDVALTSMASAVAMDANFYYWGDTSRGAIFKQAR